MIAAMIERFAQMPSALRTKARWMRLGPSGIPALVVHPDWESGRAVPVMFWMHGRTVNKELDPGRYLRWMRAGIGVCAVDLPGHGERFDADLQQAANTWEVVSQMIGEIDGIVTAIGEAREFDTDCMGVGGMSAGGMATLARLCGPHPFICASVEATTGSWEHQRDREMFRGHSMELIDQFNPIKNLDGWREIPFQAIHAKLDEWVSIDGQAAFIESLRSRYRDPSIVDFVQYDRTLAPNEHQGFGTMASDAKDRQRDFLARWLHSATE
jgi:hypothetical protein